jgi:hypothetical protein
MLFRERGFAFADDAVAFNYVVDVVTFDWNFCELIYLILRALLLPKVFPIFRRVCYIFVSHSTSEGVIHKGRVLSSFITKHFSEEINVASDFGNFSTVFDKLIGVR